MPARPTLGDQLSSGCDWLPDQVSAASSGRQRGAPPSLDSIKPMSMP
jgi:hypothetical protein